VIEAAELGAPVIVRIAALLHDIGKPHTFTVDENGVGHFYGHEEVSAEMASKIVSRLKFSTDESEAIVKLVRNHLRPGNSPKAYRRFVADMGALAQDACVLRAADIFAHSEKRKLAEINVVVEMLAGILEAESVNGFNASKLALKGDEIARIFAVKGKEIGVLKNKATQAVIDGLVTNEKEELIAFLSS
jgi:tRNA nucleotidyltransferase (CCA-adding enzyme)